MIKRTALVFFGLAAAAAIVTPVASARPDLPEAPTFCTYVPDLDGHLYGPVCIEVKP